MSTDMYGRQSRGRNSAPRFGGPEANISFGGQARPDDYRRRWRSRSPWSPGDVRLSGSRSRSRSRGRGGRSRSRSRGRGRRSRSRSPAARHGHRRRSRSRSRRRSRSRDRRRSRSPAVRVPHGREPPSLREQTSLWAAQDAADRLNKPPASPEEVELMRNKPPQPKAGEELTDEQVQFHFELLRIRRDTPKTSAHRLAYYRKPLKSSSELPPDTPLPVGHSVWTALIQPRQFNRSERTSTADILRQATVNETMVIGSASFTTSTSASSKLPAQPTTGIEFFKFSSSLADFNLASGRFSRAEGDAHAKHISHVMGLFEKYPASDVMLYDDDFRVLRHRLQDSNWSTPEESLLQLHIRDPVSERAAAYTAPPGSRLGGGTDGPPQPRKRLEKPPPKPQPNKQWSRPGYKHRLIDNVEVCKNWSWGGCSADGQPCQHTAMGSSTVTPLAHNCSFCKGDHRLKDCDAYKTAHPEDHAVGKGQSGRRGSG